VLRYAFATRDNLKRSASILLRFIPQTGQ